MKLEYKMTTATWIMIATALIWLGYDVYAYLTGRSTFSIEITQFAELSNIFELTIGILLGHWLWPVYIKKD